MSGPDLWDLANDFADAVEGGSCSGELIRACIAAGLVTERELLGEAIVRGNSTRLVRVALRRARERCS